MAPVIKVASRTALAGHWSDLIDIDAGKIATGNGTIEQVGNEIFEFLLQVTSGRKRVRGSTEFTQ
jgi:galactarate dehydratase